MTTASIVKVQLLRYLAVVFKNQLLNNRNHILIKNNIAGTTAGILQYVTVICHIMQLSSLKMWVKNTFEEDTHMQNILPSPPTKGTINFYLDSCCFQPFCYFQLFTTCHRIKN